MLGSQVEHREGDQCEALLAGKGGERDAPGSGNVNDISSKMRAAILARARANGGGAQDIPRGREVVRSSSKCQRCSLKSTSMTKILHAEGRAHCAACLRLNFHVPYF